MEALIITGLEPDDWLALKTIRLEALKMEPQSFGSKYEDNFNRSDSEWQNQAKNPDLNYFLATYAGYLVGMVGLSKIKNASKYVELIALYVNHKYRRKGIGRNLVAAAVKHAQRIPDLTNLKLWVYKDKQSTINFYKLCNFRVTKEIGSDINIPEMYHNTVEMEYNL